LHDLVREKAIVKSGIKGEDMESTRRRQVYGMREEAGLWTRSWYTDKIEGLK